MVDKLVQEVGSAMCACVCAVASLVVNRYALITVAERSDYWHQYTTNSHTSYQACIPQLMYMCTRLQAAKITRISVRLTL